MAPARKIIVSSALLTVVCAVAVAGVAFWRPHAALATAGLGVLAIGGIWYRALRDVRQIRATDREVHRVSIVQEAIREHGTRSR